MFQHITACPPSLPGPSACSYSQKGVLALPVNHETETSLTRQDETGVRLRGCYYDAVRGLGIFGTLKPALSDDEDDVPDASIGLRYSTPAVSAGVAVNPFAESLKMIWLVSIECQTASPDKSTG